MQQYVTGNSNEVQTFWSNFELLLSLNVYMLVCVELSLDGDPVARLGSMFIAAGVRVLFVIDMVKYGPIFFFYYLLFLSNKYTIHRYIYMYNIQCVP